MRFLCGLALSGARYIDFFVAGLVYGLLWKHPVVSQMKKNEKGKWDGDDRIIFALFSVPFGFMGRSLHYGCSSFFSLGVFLH